MIRNTNQMDDDIVNQHDHDNSSNYVRSETLNDDISPAQLEYVNKVVDQYDYNSSNYQKNNAFENNNKSRQLKDMKALEVKNSAGPLNQNHLDLNSYFSNDSNKQGKYLKDQKMKIEMRTVQNYKRARGQSYQDGEYNQPVEKVLMIFKGNTLEKQLEEQTGNLSTLSKQSLRDIKRVIKPLYQNNNNGDNGEVAIGKVSRNKNSNTSLREMETSSKNEYKQSSPSTHKMQGQTSSRNSREYSRIESRSNAIEKLLPDQETFINSIDPKSPASYFDQLQHQLTQNEMSDDQYGIKSKLIHKQYSRQNARSIHELQHFSSQRGARNQNTSQEKLQSSNQPSLNKKMKVIDSLFGQNQNSHLIKNEFIKMVINKNKDMKFRDIAETQDKTEDDSRSTFNPRGREALNSLKDIKSNFRSMNQSLDQTYQQSYNYLNRDTSTYSHLKRQKPFMRGACAPGKIYRDQAHFNPKHQKTIYQIEDIIQMQQQSHLSVPVSISKYDDIDALDNTSQKSLRKHNKSTASLSSGEQDQPYNNYGSHINIQNTNTKKQPKDEEALPTQETIVRKRSEDVPIEAFPNLYKDRYKRNQIDEVTEPQLTKSEVNQQSKQQLLNELSHLSLILQQQQEKRSDRLEYENGKIVEQQESTTINESLDDQTPFKIVHSRYAIKQNKGKHSRKVFQQLPNIDLNTQVIDQVNKEQSQIKNSNSSLRHSIKSKRATNSKLNVNLKVELDIYRNKTKTSGMNKSLVISTSSETDGNMESHNTTMQTFLKPTSRQDTEQSINNQNFNKETHIFDVTDRVVPQPSNDYIQLQNASERLAAPLDSSRVKKQHVTQIVDQNIELFRQIVNVQGQNNHQENQSMVYDQQQQQSKPDMISQQPYTTAQSSFNLQDKSRSYKELIQESTAHNWKQKLNKLSPLTKSSYNHNDGITSKTYQRMIASSTTNQLQRHLEQRLKEPENYGSQLKRRVNKDMFEKLKQSVQRRDYKKDALRKGKKLQPIKDCKGRNPNINSDSFGIRSNTVMERDNDFKKYHLLITNANSSIDSNQENSIVQESKHHIISTSIPSKRASQLPGVSPNMRQETKTNQSSMYNSKTFTTSLGISGINGHQIAMKKSLYLKHNQDLGFFNSDSIEEVIVDGNPVVENNNVQISPIASGNIYVKNSKRKIMTNANSSKRNSMILKQQSISSVTKNNDDNSSIHSKTLQKFTNTKLNSISLSKEGRNTKYSNNDYSESQNNTGLDLIVINNNNETQDKNINNKSIYKMAPQNEGHFRSQSQNVMHQQPQVILTTNASINSSQEMLQQHYNQELSEQLIQQYDLNKQLTKELSDQNTIKSKQNHVNNQYNSLQMLKNQQFVFVDQLPDNGGNYTRQFGNQIRTEKNRRIMKQHFSVKKDVEFQKKYRSKYLQMNQNLNLYGSKMSLQKIPRLESNSSPKVVKQLQNEDEILDVQQGFPQVVTKFESNSLSVVNMGDGADDRREQVEMKSKNSQDKLKSEVQKIKQRVQVTLKKVKIDETEPTQQLDSNRVIKMQEIQQNQLGITDMFNQLEYSLENTRDNQDGVLQNSSISPPVILLNVQNSDQKQNNHSLQNSNRENIEEPVPNPSDFERQQMEDSLKMQPNWSPNELKKMKQKNHLMQNTEQSAWKKLNLYPQSFQFQENLGQIHKIQNRQGKRFQYESHLKSISSMTAQKPGQNNNNGMSKSQVQNFAHYVKNGSHHL